MNYKQEELSQVQSALDAIMKARVATPDELFRFRLNTDADILDFIKESAAQISREIAHFEAINCFKKVVEFQGYANEVAGCINLIGIYRRVAHHAAMNGL